MKTIYISLPITGKENTYEQRLEDAVAWCKRNYPDADIITPKEIADTLDEANVQLMMTGESKGPLNYENYLLTDLSCIIKNIDIIVFCEGWKDSRGCRLEHAVANEFGKEITYKK